MFVSVCISLYLSICLLQSVPVYMFVPVHIVQIQQSRQQQSATVSKQSSSHCSHCCLFISVYIVHISAYLFVSDLYPYIYAYICSYLLIQFISGPGPIARTNLTGTNLRDQADNHSCAYVLICDNLCVYQTYVCTYVLISGHICLYPKT